MATPMISAQNVHKSFGQLEVLKGIDLEVQPGEVACLLGPSGSGKSTFLRCVNHLDKATAGRLYVDGELIGYREKNGTLYEISEKEAAEQRSDIGMVFQSFNLFPHRTVIENIIEAPVQVKKIPEETARARAMELLEDVGLASKAITTQYSSLAASNSALPSLVRWPWILSLCFSTNLRRPSTPSSSAKCCAL